MVLLCPAECQCELRPLQRKVPHGPQRCGVPTSGRGFVVMVGHQMAVAPALFSSPCSRLRATVATECSPLAGRRTLSGSTEYLTGRWEHYLLVWCRVHAPLQGEQQGADWRLQHTQMTSSTSQGLSPPPPLQPGPTACKTSCRVRDVRDPRPSCRVESS